MILHGTIIFNFYCKLSRTGLEKPVERCVRNLMDSVKRELKNEDGPGTEFYTYIDR